MQKSRFIFLSLLFIGIAGLTSAQNTTTTINELENVQMYNRAIHIMAMLMVGFGFLMVFVRKYGRSAITATFLLVSVSLPLYFLMKSSAIFHHTEGMSEIQLLILAEFGAASLLIAAGAILGRIKMVQYIILGLIFIPFYMFNEWIVLDSGLGIIKGDEIADTGGSIVIHAFGAIFGIGLALSLTKKADHDKPIEADATSDRFSLLGSMILWLFWPSFCAALVPAAAIPATVINVFLALCGSTLATYILSVVIRGKINAADIANAALAGGVAIGATCDYATPVVAIIIGVVAGALSTFGFAVVQSKQQKLLKAIDTCGVTNLHGLPGLMGGIAAIFVVPNLNVSNQVMGIVVTFAIAIIGGLITGVLISLFGRRKELYSDQEEFEECENDNHLDILIEKNELFIKEKELEHSKN